MYVGHSGWYKSEGTYPFPMPLTQVLLFDMFSKVLLGCLILVVAVHAIPVYEEDDEDLPVYTEKVVPSKPTAPAKVASSSTIAKAHRFSPKKLHTVPKTFSPKKPRHLPPPEETNYPSPVVPDTPKTLRKAAKLSREIKPVYSSSRPVKSVLRADHAAPRASYSSPRHAHAPVQSSYAAPQPVHVPVQLSYAAPQPVHAPVGPVYAAADGGDYKSDQYFSAPVGPVNAAADGGDYKSDQYEKPQPYSFGYDVKDEYGATQNRQEQGDDYGNKRGSYGYTDGYGIYRQVEYVADKDGFRATVKTNEPGTDNEDPADVKMLSEAQSAQHISKY